VPESSPAAQAGLEAHTDYIVGSPEVVFNNENDFHNLLKVRDLISILRKSYNIHELANAPSEKILSRFADLAFLQIHFLFFLLIKC
jgi:hypothetical protein